MTTTSMQQPWKLRFFAIWSGQALSLVGSSLTQFVLIWWITQETGSANAVAIAGMMALLPAALFSPLGGAVADRFSRRWIMVVADAITAGCMVILVILFTSGQIQLWHLYILLFVRSTMQSFQQPASVSSTVNLVPVDWLDRVAGMNQSMQGIMTIAAAPLGALALAALPIQGALMIDVVTAVLGILPLFFFTIPQPAAQSLESPAAIFKDILDGARYIARNRGLLLFYLIQGLVVMTIMPCFGMTPLLVKQQFNGGVNDVALMEGLAGIGIIAGGILIGLKKLANRRVPVIMISFALSCVTIALTALAPGNQFALAIFWWFVSGVTYSTGNAPLIALLQKIIPNEYQGRSMALLSMVSGLAGPVGLAIFGPVGEAFGVQSVFVIGGLLSTFICLGALASKTLRSLD